ncbi:22785_t:CDS:2, partial [Racocetra persica]
ANQEKIRVELYDGLQNVLTTNDEALQDSSHIRKKIILLSSFIELQTALLPGQSAYDHPDLCARVFNMKLNALLDDILKKEIFSKTTAYIYVIEAQKYGLLHTHMLKMLADEDKPYTTDDFDLIVLAEISNSDKYSNEYVTVVKYMMHRPCGVTNIKALYMQNGKCSKGYPKLFQSVFCENED